MIKRVGIKMSKKIPIHMNEEDYKDTLELAQLLGMDDNVYGWFPKTVKFSITFTQKALKSYQNFIPMLKPDEMDIMFSSIKRYIMQQRKLKQAEKLQKEAKKV
jgi:hypothetical protein